MSTGQGKATIFQTIAASRNARPSTEIDAVHSAGAENEEIARNAIPR
jgi:hypothetical protein